MAAQRIGVVGGGIIGLAVARRLTQALPDAQVTVLDKERHLAAHQTGHNSGVAHAGLYYAPGSLKAQLCRRGIGLLKEFCAEHSIAYEECGKLVVARDAGELGRLNEIERRARANGVPALTRLDGERMREVEPHVRGVSALHSPSTAIVDFVGVANGLAADLATAGGSVRLGFEVTRFARARHEVRLAEPGGEELAFDRAVVCAGLQSDRLGRLAGGATEPTIVPFRGEYHRLVPARANLVRGLIYPVPDPAYPFLGVHFTRRVGGGVDIGPNAVLAFAREGYRRRDVSLLDLRQTLASPGFRRLAARHWRMGARELYGSISRRAFVAAARSFVPELRAPDVVPAPAGVRAQALDPDGSLVDDFRIESLGPVVVVRNAPSPGATSSLAIAEHIVELSLTP
ncbi:MAG: L-2-hydroxyglutarate oxidase [Solirubrobacteraceae bacterium]